MYSLITYQHFKITFSKLIKVYIPTIRHQHQKHILDLKEQIIANVL